MASLSGSGKKYVPYIQGTGEVDESLFNFGTPTVAIGGRELYDDRFRNPDDFLRGIEDIFSNFNADEYMADISALLETVKEKGVYGNVGCLIIVAGTVLGGLAFLGWYASYANKKAKKKWGNNNDEGDDSKEGTIVFEPPAILIKKLLNVFENIPH